MKQFVKKFPLVYSLVKNIYLIYQKFISRRKWMRLITSKKEIKLELGSGNKKGKNGWTTVDIGYSDIN